MGRTRNLIAGLALALAGVIVGAPMASAQDPGPAYTDWNPQQIGFPSNASASPRANCAKDSGRCIDRTIAEMYRRFNTVVPTCDDNNVFSLTYIRVTEDIRNAVGDGFYPDEAWLNRQDATFARSYFLAYDNYQAGRTALVPPSWRIAFDAGRDGKVEGIGNLLLSMNAHVNRDFPFILYHAGLVDSKGNSYKAQHDSYNQRLRALYRPMIDELSTRFDDSINDYDIPGTTADDDALFDLLVAWREAAWPERPAPRRRRQRRRATSGRGLDRGLRGQPGRDDLRRERLRTGGGDTGSRRPLRRSRRGRIPPIGADPTSRTSARLPPPDEEEPSSSPRCAPNGPGPCNGIARGPGSARVRFSLQPGQRGHVRLPVAPGDSTVRIVLKSQLGPGDGVIRRRTLRASEG